MNGSPPGSTIHGVLQQEYWSGLPFSSPGASSPPRDQAQVSQHCRRILDFCATWEGWEGARARFLSLHLLSRGVPPPTAGWSQSLPGEVGCLKLSLRSWGALLRPPSQGDQCWRIMNVLDGASWWDQEAEATGDGLWPPGRAASRLACPAWPRCVLHVPLCPASPTTLQSCCNYIFPVQGAAGRAGCYFPADNHPLASTGFGLKAFSGLQAPLLPAPLPGLNFLRFFPPVTAPSPLAPLSRCPVPLPCPSGQCLCLQRTLWPLSPVPETSCMDFMSSFA